MSINIKLYIFNSYALNKKGGDVPPLFLFVFQIPALSGIDWNSNFFHGGVHMLRRVGECILFAASMADFMVVFYLWAA